MKIAIDIHPTIANVAGKLEGGHTRTGVGQYTYRILRELLELEDANEYCLFAFRRRGSPKPFAERRGVAYRFIRVPPARLYRVMHRDLHVPLPVDLLTGPSDLFVFSNYVRLPLVFGGRSVVMIYDLSFLRFPEHTEPRNGKYLRAQVPRSARESDHVVTISESSKREIVAAFSIPESKVTVAYPGIDQREFRPASEPEIERVRRRYDLPPRYLLHVGTLEPRKNLDTLLAARRALPEELRAAYPLVLVGGQGWLDAGVVAEVRRLAAAGQAVATGYVPDSDLSAILSGAAAFVFPSLYEGWGMPVVEAMACGVPVVTSGRSSLPEAAGDSALMVDPRDTAALAQAIARVLEDRDLRATMIEKGFRHAGRFSWRHSAEKLLAVFESLRTGA